MKHASGVSFGKKKSRKRSLRVGISRLCNFREGEFVLDIEKRVFSRSNLIVMKKFLLFFSLVLGLAFVGCQKSEDFVNPEFMCECGSLNWNGQEYPLLMAEYVLEGEDLFLSRRYFLTTDIRLEGESKPHNLSFQLGIDSVDQAVLYIPADTVFNLVEEVDQNDELFPYRTYTGTNGIVNVNPAILGGTESVSFQIILRETVNGDTVGFDIPFSGNFTVDI